MIAFALNSSGIYEGRPMSSPEQQLLNFGVGILQQWGLLCSQAGICL
jgi:hypothetical protein